MRHAGALLSLFISVSGFAAALSPDFMEGISNGETNTPLTASGESEAEGRADAPLNLPVTGCEIRLNFMKASADSILLTGAVFTGTDFVVEGKTVSIDIGGITRTFTLNKFGRAKSGNATFAVKTRAGSLTVPAPAARFSLRIKKSALAADLANERLTADARVDEEIRTVPMTVVFAGVVHQANRTLIYSARPGRFGLAQYDRSLDR